MSKLYGTVWTRAAAPSQAVFKLLGHKPLSFFLSFLQIFHLLLTNNVSIPVILWQSGLRNLYLLSNKALHITPASSFKHAPALCFGYTRRCLQKALPRDLYVATAVSKP